jgi:hypothetical protein
VWFVQNRSDIMATGNVSILPAAALGGGAHLLSFVNPERLKRILTRLLDTNEFLGPNGIRSLSRVHLAEPFTLDNMSIGYEPAEATVPNVNSNWRGPVWMPINYLLIESLEKFGSFLGDQFTVEYPVGSGMHLTLPQVAKQPSLASTGKDLFMEALRCSRTIQTGRITFYFSNTFTAIMARVWEPIIRPAGADWSPI